MMKRLAKHPCSELKTAQTDAFGVILPDSELEWGHPGSGDLVIVFRASTLGDPAAPLELGRQLMSSFLTAVVAFTPPPAAIILYSTAVRLALADSDDLEDLKKLAASGTEIMLCQTSLDQLEVASQTVIGRVCDWHELADRMRRAARLLWP
jgi:hypothetical protein